MKRISLFSALGLFVFLMSGAPVHAQGADSTAAPSTEVQGQGKGIATLTDWPASLPQLLREMGTDAPYLLPRIDSLALEYRYAVNDSTSQWSFVLGWTPAHRVLYEGEVVPFEKGPSDVRMANVELRADVEVEGEAVGEMIVAVDSMALRPLPSIYSFEVTVSHRRVFLDASAEEARRALQAGITLDSLVVERMGFISGPPSTSDRSERRPPSDTQERTPEPQREPSVYEPRTSIYIGWRVAPRPYYIEEREGKRTVLPRRETMGRGTNGDDSETRTTAGRGGDDKDKDSDGGTRGRSDSSDDDDEEDDDEDETDLRAPALGAAAAIGLVAYAGGTIGLYGRGDTPIGLAAGYTHRSGGIQLQASVNGAVIEGGSGQKLTVKALGFYDVFSARVQPAVGIGVQIDPQRKNDVVPSASVALAGNFGRFVIFGGFDVVQQTPEVGVSYNFRYEKDDEEEEAEQLQ